MPAAVKGKPRFRSKYKGVCYCCNNGQLIGSGIKRLPLYPVGTPVGVKLGCAYCCKNPFYVRPGFTHDGNKMADRFATPEGIAAVERENKELLDRRMSQHAHEVT